LKKLRRNIDKFGAFDLFSNLAAEHGFKLDDADSQQDFIEKVRNTFECSKNNKIIIYGKRIEALFAYVVGALGEAALLKQEDEGSLYYIGEDIIVPDYRIILKDSSQYLVEVKNHHSENIYDEFVVKKDYYQKLRKYSDLCNVDLKFGIYFSVPNKWALISIDAFNERDDSYTIDFASSIAKSEMALIGDRTIGTRPDLELQLLTNSNEANEIDKDGKAVFTTREINIYSAGHKISDSLEKEIAFYLIQFGDWEEKQAEAIIERGKLLGMRFIFAPHIETEDNFSLIGTLSTMISNMFKQHTVVDGKVIAVDSHLDPERFKVFIPTHYKGKELPLWRFTIQPNHDFEGLTKQ